PQVVVRPVDPDGKKRDAEGTQPRAQFTRLADMRRLAEYTSGDLDLGRVPAGVGAVSAENFHLALEGFRVTEAVPDIGVLGDQLQCLQLATAADEQWDVPGRRRVQAGEPGLDTWQGCGQVVEPTSRSTEIVAVLPIVHLAPARTDAEDQPPPADVVHGAGHVCEQV